jgi:outer membrane protein assembly factor BamB
VLSISLAACGSTAHNKAAQQSGARGVRCRPSVPAAGALPLVVAVDPSNGSLCWALTDRARGEFHLIGADDAHLIGARHACGQSGPVLSVLDTDGRVLWQRPMGYTSQATLAGDVIAVGAPDVPLTGIGVATGRTLWTTDTSGRVVAGNKDAIVVDSGGAGPAAQTVVLDPATGRTRWHVTPGGMVTLTPSRVLITPLARTPSTTAYDLYNGHVLWSDAFAVATHGDDATPLVTGDVAVGNARYVGGPPKFVAIDLATGRQLWDAEGDVAQAGDGSIYVVSGTTSLTALDAHTGKARWSTSASTDVGVAGSGIVLTHDGAVDAATGRDRWRFDSSPQHTAFDRWQTAGFQRQTYGSSPGRLFLGYYDCGGD